MLHALLSFLVSTAVAIAAAPQAKPAQSFRLVEVQAPGAKRYTVQEVTKASGLAIGRTVTVEDVVGAANRLAGSGLFTAVSYKYVTNGGQIVVTFEVEDAQWTTPVAFDNFVWASDEEIIAAVRTDVPSFDGTAPPSDGTVTSITQALSAFLKAKSIPGDVHYAPEGEYQTGKLLRHIFSVKNPSPKLCGLEIPGASAIRAERLVEAARETVGNDYSRLLLRRIASGTLTRLYRERGYWRAEFADPAVATARGGSCQGVTASLAVNEGAPYTVATVTFAGNAALQASALERMVALRPGDVANVVKIDEALLDMRKAYGKVGHLTMRAQYAHALDDAGRKASFEINVVEGPQFRMGALEVTGLSPKDAEFLQKRWSLAPGAVFDDSYPSRFYQEELVPRVRSGRAPFPAVRVNEQAQTVDVKLAFGAQ